MWVLKLRTRAEDQFLGSYALKHGISLSGYPLSSYTKKGGLYVILAGFMKGEKKNKKAFLKDIKKDKRLVNFENKEDFNIVVTKQPTFTKELYNPKIIRPNPMIIDKEGFHLWELASFDRDTLSKIIEFAEKKLEGEIISFKKEKIGNISFTNILTELTGNQREALRLALDKGYYDYPKKVKMEKLAKMKGNSYSTFQAHLKKAEGKILKGSFKNI